VVSSNHLTQIPGGFLTTMPKTMMKTLYSVDIQGLIPVTAKLIVLADSEYEAASLVQRISECEKAGVKSVFELEMYPGDFLRFRGVAEITPIDSGDAVGKVWNPDKIEELLGKSAE
jgi:hypothetical protein